MAISPMSGVTDDPFRLMFLKYGKPDVFWTEFVSVAALVSEKGRDYCLRVLKFAPNERPIVAQIFGSDPVQFKKAAELLVELGFDGIDINMGCPDKDIEKQGAGSALIKNPQLAKEIIGAVKKGAGKIPVSVKTRIGYDENQIAEWIPALLEEKPAVLTVHFRTRKQGYASQANWELAGEILKLRDLYSPKTLIIGNGDVKSLVEAKQLIKKIGLDGVMIGRGVLGNPWFFSNYSPTTKERLNAVVEHVKIFENCERPFDTIKKHLHAYVKGFDGARELREKLMLTNNPLEVKKIIEDLLTKMKINMV